MAAVMVVHSVMPLTVRATGDQRHFAATAILVTHPWGDPLIDAGLGSDARGPRRDVAADRPLPFEVTQTVSEQLDASGYDRSRLLGVPVTHSL